MVIQRSCNEGPPNSEARRLGLIYMLQSVLATTAHCHMEQTGA
jgi:hypothetical protein